MYDVLQLYFTYIILYWSIRILRVMWVFLFLCEVLDHEYCNCDSKTSIYLSLVGQLILLGNISIVLSVTNPLKHENLFPKTYCIHRRDLDITPQWLIGLVLFQQPMRVWHPRSLLRLDRLGEEVSHQFTVNTIIMAAYILVKLHLRYHPKMGRHLEHPRHLMGK